MTINLLPIKDQVSIYCEKYSQKGWFPGISGGLAILNQPTPTTRSIVFTPDNISKGNLKSGDLFEFKWVYDKQTFIKPALSRDSESHIPAQNLQIYTAALLLNSPTAVVAEVCSSWFCLGTRVALRTWEKSGNNHSNKFRIAHWGLLETLCKESEINLPIIEKHGPEEMLHSFQSYLSQANVNCILIRNYGALIWDKDFNSLTQRIEVLEELCKLQVQEFSTIC